LNIQIGLAQIIHLFEDDDVIELVDCYLFHFRRHREVFVPKDGLFVCDLYEDWHLKSLSSNKHVIEQYLQDSGSRYNGGFVPIIARASTFRRLLPLWEDIHRDILRQPHEKLIHWWAGMFALQAACERVEIEMIAKDWCYIPGINRLEDTHYTGHYSCDFNYFSKYKFPDVNATTFPDNLFYLRVKDWLQETGRWNPAG
jgi:hypothetical protein